MEKVRLAAIEAEKHKAASEKLEGEIVATEKAILKEKEIRLAKVEKLRLEVL